MTIVLTAICADQLVAADGSIRPQVVVEAMEGVAGRLIRQEQKQQSSPVRAPASSRQWVEAAAPAVPSPLWHVHPSSLNPQDCRLPPPTR